MTSIRKRAKRTSRRTGAPTLATMDHRQLGKHLSENVKSLCERTGKMGTGELRFYASDELVPLLHSLDDTFYGHRESVGDYVHPHPPTISNVRRIAGEGVTEQDHIKVLAANVMYRNMLVMGDI